METRRHENVEKQTVGRTEEKERWEQRARDRPDHAASTGQHPRWIQCISAASGAFVVIWLKLPLKPQSCADTRPGVCSGFVSLPCIENLVLCLQYFLVFSDVKSTVLSLDFSSSRGQIQPQLKIQLSAKISLCVSKSTLGDSVLYLPFSTSSPLFVAKTTGISLVLTSVFLSCDVLETDLRLSHPIPSGITCSGIRNCSIRTPIQPCHSMYTV